MKLLSKQLLQTGVLLLAVALFFSACKKDKDPVYPMEGLWVGKYGVGTNAPTSGFSMVVESGGKVTVADGASITSSSKATGTWTAAGGVFKATYTYIGTSNTFSIQANWSDKGTLTDGTYGNGSNATGGGTWFMNRVN